MSVLDSKINLKIPNYLALLALYSGDESLYYCITVDISHYSVYTYITVFPSGIFILETISAFQNNFTAVYVC
jgi:hypothetical protein